MESSTTTATTDFCGIYRASAPQSTLCSVVLWHACTTSSTAVLHCRVQDRFPGLICAWYKIPQHLVGENRTSLDTPTPPGIVCMRILELHGSSTAITSAQTAVALQRSMRARWYDARRPLVHTTYEGQVDIPNDSQSTSTTSTTRDVRQNPTYRLLPSFRAPWYHILFGSFKKKMYDPCVFFSAFSHTNLLKVRKEVSKCSCSTRCFFLLLFNFNPFRTAVSCWGQLGTNDL